MLESNLFIFCDGGARGNPGPAAAAFVAKNSKEELIEKRHLYFGERTNNFAEYQSVIMALEWLYNFSSLDKTKKIFIYLDSELVTKQINGIYKIKSVSLIPLSIKVSKLVKKIGKKIIFKHIERNKNKEADFLVNKALDQNT